MSKYDCELNLKDRNSLSVLIERINPNSIVLEFGPANGRMTKYMKEQLNCKVFAVEIDEDSAKDAGQYTEEIVVDSIENYTWKEEFKNVKFDYIIFADVLEHLYYSEKVLLSIREFLKENGSVLVSIPNIAHNSIIINLLKNEFNYNPTGLLDNTHIRFFTKKTFDELIKKTGYFISYETAIFLNPESTEFRNSYDELKPEISEYLQSLSFGEIYQLIYEFRKNETEKISDFSDKYIVYNKFFIQLFVENENPISEENSLKLPVSQNAEIQKFEFDLKNLQNIKNIRLDPLNDSCVIDIEKICLLLDDGNEIDLIPYISANVCSHQGKSYFFEFFDPQIYFENIDLSVFNISKFIVIIKYAHIAKDSLTVLIEQKENYIQEQRNIIEQKESYIQEQRNIIEQKESYIQEQRNIIENIKNNYFIKILKKLKLIKEKNEFVD